MNNTFNAGRFGQLFKKYTIEHGRANILSVFVLIGILFIILGITALFDRRLSAGAQTAMFSVGLLATGCIFTSMIFISLSDKKKAIPELTLPVSHFEKYLVAWLYSFPIFLLIFIGCFYFTASIVRAITPETIGYSKDSLINIIDPEQDAIAALFGYAILHGLCFWGALFFKRLHFIKTAFVLFIGIMVLMIVNRLLLTVVMVKGSFTEVMPFSTVHFRDVDGRIIYIGAPDSVKTVGLFIIAALVLLFWASAFFRLKEKEV